MLPIALNGEAIHAVVIGGGKVGTRKALALHDAGASVKVIAPQISDAIRDAATASSRLQLDQREYAGADDLSDAEIVFAATDSTDLNLTIAADARSLHRLVDVVSDGSLGSFVSMATHRDGQVTIGVTAGGEPKEAIRIRDSIAGQMNGRVAR
jgi:siroheme synthase-like protein